MPAKPITLRRADNTWSARFAYSDIPPGRPSPTPPGIRSCWSNPLSNPDHADPLSWRASVAAGGSPAPATPLDYADVEIRPMAIRPTMPDADGDGFTTRAEYFLGGNPLAPDPGLAPVFAMEPGTMLFHHPPGGCRGSESIPESSADLGEWGAPPGWFCQQRPPAGTPALERLVSAFRTRPVGGTRHFVRFALR